MGGQKSAGIGSRRLLSPFNFGQNDHPQKRQNRSSSMIFEREHLQKPSSLKPPNGLKPRGRGLWREITAHFHLDPAEVELLRELCRCVDRIDELDREIVERGLLVTGNRGQIPKANPALFELRETQKTVSVLIAQLKLPKPRKMPSFV